MKAVLVGINGDPSVFYTTGLKIGGVKYTFLKREEGKSAYGKKSDSGVIVVKTMKCMYNVVSYLVR